MASQKDIVIARVREVGFVDNFWAIENKVSLRLSAVIHSLTKAGWKFDGKFGDGPHSKNFYYYLVNEPGKAPKTASNCCFSFEKFGYHDKSCAVVQKPIGNKEKGTLFS